MDTIRFRKMTLKSTLGFGKYRDLKVGDVITLNKTVYLRWCYYNLSMISFMDDVLDQIHIPEEFRIEKPGKDPDKCDQLNKILWKKIDGFTKLKRKSHRRKVRKAVCNSIEIRQRSKYTKGTMQRTNQGHKK